MMRAVLGWSDDELSRLGAAMLRAAVTPAVLRRYLRGVRGWDAGPCVAEVRAPTLLTQFDDARYTTVENARALAGALPDGRLVLIDAGTTAAQSERQRAETARFLGVQPVPSFHPDAQPPSSTAIIFFADIADSTALTERLGDAAFREQARALDEALRAVVHEHGGTVIDAKTLGDGILATFPAASQAIAAALACADAGRRAGLPLHLGAHAGDVIREDGNVFGGAVNIAARISALSAPGEVLVSDIVRGLARTSAGVTSEDRGEHALKGVVEPQRVFAAVSPPV
jgi:class 3 adenylate cyclase